MKKFDINIYLTALKTIGIIVTIVGCYGFIISLKLGVYVVESISVIAMGLGSLGYRKHLTTKKIDFNDKGNSKQDNK